MAISFQKITYIYDAGMPYAHAAINDIDLELEEGKITAIIGETGSGKSSFSRMTSSSMSQRVSPVVVDFKPTIAPISPAWSCSTS